MKCGGVANPDPAFEVPLRYMNGPNGDKLCPVSLLYNEVKKGLFGIRIVCSFTEAILYRLSQRQGNAAAIRMKR